MSGKQPHEFTQDEVRLLHQTYASVKRPYGDLLDCVVSVLCAQADYELKEQGATGKKLHH